MVEGGGLPAATGCAVRVENLSVTYRTTVEKKPTLKKTLIRLGRRERIIREI
jgi:teichoic acid transport system ATP-binding protein